MRVCDCKQNNSTMEGNIDTVFQEKNPIMATEVKQSGFVDNWQNGKTLPECNLHMLETEDFCDVSFRVGSDGHVIRAHRYVLVSRSCVFHAMFCGEMAEQGEITIPDIEADVFKDFLRFLYSDNVVLTAENVPGLLYTSRKYDVDALSAQCAYFLETSLTEENVCEILERCHGYVEVDIEEKALKMLEKSGERTLKSAGFKKLCPPCYEKFLTSEDLRLKEEEVFEATLTWAKERCEEENLEPSPENQRKVLGTLIHQIRFPAFSHEYLISTVRMSQILKPEERLLLIDHSGNPDIDIAPFVARPREATNHYVRRFRNDWSTEDGSTDTCHKVSFSTNKNIELIGVQLYGPVSFPSSLYTINIKLYLDNFTLLSEPFTSVEFSLKGKRDLNDVIFPDPVEISAGRQYGLSVLLKGSHPYNMGSEGKTSVEVDDVTFKFIGNDWSFLGTTTTQGQIPGLIWRPK